MSSSDHVVHHVLSEDGKEMSDMLLNIFTRMYDGGYETRTLESLTKHTELSGRVDKICVGWFGYALVRRE